MPEQTAILAIDQGTTSSRAIVFSTAGEIVSVAQKELTQHFPADGWVEHDADEIWNDTVAVCREAARAAVDKGFEIACIGITNQRETTVVWDRETGQPVCRAIVWQDRRTAPLCEELRDGGHEATFTRKTGLLLDPYFSGTKVRWILDNVEGVRERAESGALAFGTIDSFLVWRLTGGVHVSDATNASRTLLFNLHDQTWDDELLAMLDIPASLLPQVTDNAGILGETDILQEIVGGPIPITGMAGDQQAALVGQACFQPGMIKSTYGTGCFVLLNTGSEAISSSNRLLTTVAYRLGGKPVYALEGSIFVAGAAVQWLRDKLQIIDSSPESEAIAKSVPGNGGVYLVPAFTGLGAPWWDADARGAIYGLTRDTGRAHIVRATLESAAYQTRDLLDAMRRDGAEIEALRVDGGMAENDWLMQFLADIVPVRVDRPQVTETTAFGAALLAGVGQGIWDDLPSAAAAWSAERTFNPEMGTTGRDRLLAGWKNAVERTRTSK